MKIFAKRGQGILCLFIAFALIIPLSGCKKKTEPAPVENKVAEAPTPPKSIKEKPKQTEEQEQEKPLPVKPIVRYEYDPRGKKDPFVPFKKPQSVVTPEWPLTNFDIKTLRLVGVIAGLAVPKAVFEAPDGKSYVVTPGTKIGKSDGTVVDILPDEIIVVEKKIDKNGNLKDEQIMMKLHHEDEERGSNLW